MNTVYWILSIAGFIILCIAVIPLAGDSIYIADEELDQIDRKQKGDQPCP